MQRSGFPVSCRHYHQLMEVPLARFIDSTCLQGLDLALKWATLANDEELARDTSTVAHGCPHRGDCQRRTECDHRLAAIDTWLAESECDEALPRPTPA